MSDPDVVNAVREQVREIRASVTRKSNLEGPAGDACSLQTSIIIIIIIVKHHSPHGVSDAL
jgi:hypothetical protein